jgi:preprotein translocase subunit SecG
LRANTLICHHFAARATQWNCNLVSGEPNSALMLLGNVAGPEGASAARVAAASEIMMEFAANDRDQKTATEAGRKRAFETALAELALTVCLILSIVVILAVAGASGAMAQGARSDLIMMEEGTSSSLTTMIILTVIAVVMGALTILALRDVAPAHSKRGQRRTTSSASTQISRR